MIGILGGTFDPVHLGHFELAKATLDYFHFKKLFLVPAKKNPLKNSEASASPKHRLAMLKLATTQFQDARVSVLDFELQQTGPSYTLHTIEFLTVAEKTNDLVLIMGNEVFQSLPSWHKPEELLNKTHLAVINRAKEDTVSPISVLKKIGVKNFRISAGGQRFLHSNDSRWIELLNFPVLPLSSTWIRKALGSGKLSKMDISRTLHKPVWEYIFSNGLYI